MHSKFAHTALGLLGSALFLLSLVSGQGCPNNLATYDPNLRTTCANGTFYILPVPSSTVAAAVKPYNLLPLPTNDATLFPNGFPAGNFPVVVSLYYENDIRMSVLQLPSALLTASISVPWVDRDADGETAFSYSLKTYVGGTGGNNISPYVPAIVGSLGGTTITVANFVPNTAPYMEINSSPAEYTAQVKDVFVPNPVSGPGIYVEAIDTDFFTVDSNQFTAHTFHEVISQPQVLTNTMCQRNPIYFNQTFTQPIFRNGTVTLYSLGAVFPGVYSHVAGYSGSGEMVGYNAEACTAAEGQEEQSAEA